MRDPKYSLSFRIRKSVAYHDSRRGHFAFLDAGVKILGLVIAFAAFTENFGDDVLVKILAGVFVVGSAVSIVRRFGSMAHLHESLYKDFIGLQQKLVQMEDPTRERLDALESEVLAVEAREPPVYAALNRFCHNQICQVDGETDSIQPLKTHHYLLKNFLSFSNLPRKQPAGRASG